MARTLADDRLLSAGASPPAVDGYRLEREIGRGGLGRVFLAWDLKLERPVALKELLETDAVGQARFEREARITARLQHPGIIPIYEAGRAPGGAPFYAMRFVEGKTLEARLEEEPTLEGRLRLLPSVLAAIDAVAYAHSEGVVHRDLKPANVLCGAFGETVVIDWGISSEGGGHSGATRPPEKPAHLSWGGSVSGTPGYMSPEQRRGEPPERSDDIYSLGATLWHVVLGHHPGQPRLSPRALEALKKVPEDLLAVISRAMHEEPSWRYASAAQLAEDLRRWLAGRPVSAFDYSSFALARRWVRRHLAAVCVALLGLLAAGLTAGLGVSGMARERQLATERSWQLTMLQARSALADDPTAALGWLLTLPRDYQVPQARALAASALDRGVSRHVLRGHDASVSGLCFAGPALVSIDLRQLFTWSPATGQPGLKLQVPDESQHLLCSADGRWAVFDQSSEIRVADLAEARLLTLPGHGGLVTALALDGARLYSASSDGSLRRWALAEARGEVLALGPVPLSALALDAPRARVATGDAHGELKIYDAASGALLRQLAAHEGAVSSLAFTPEGLLVSAGHDGRVLVLDASLGAPRQLCQLAHPVEALLGHHRVVTLGEGLPIQAWDLETFTPTQLRASGEAPAGAAISADDGWVAASDARGIHLWRAGEPERLLRGHSVPPRKLAFSADGAWLASAGHDSQVRLWPLTPSGDRELLQVPGIAGPLSFSGDGARLLVAAASGEVLALTPQGSAVPLGHHDGVVHDVAFSPDGRFAAAAGTDLRVQLHDFTSNTSSFLSGHRARISGVGFGAGWLASAGDDGVRAWPLAPPFEGRVLSPQTSVKILPSPDGKLLASNAFEGDVVVWSMPEGKELRRLAAGSYAQGAAWSPDSKWLATGSWDRQVRVWSLAGGAPRVLGSTQGRPRRVAWDPLGRFVVSASGQGELDVWGLDGSHASGVGHREVVRNLAVSPDGARAVTTSFDGSVGVWSLPAAELVAWHEQGPSADAVAIAPSGASAVVGSVDGRFVAWSLERARELPSGEQALRALLAQKSASRIDERTGVTGTPRTEP
jgi:WD40 repeat protein